ncbi:MAG TPA: RNA polymerase sigma factor [Streptosporangiaceae bacterium]|jgi:RNA polymerase sigma-70 factor (ECF subfamily)|nr:RNA polymerase sigma factor [Streptosporangiaceae bacterium]
MSILRVVIGEAFAELLEAARGGNDQAFAVLWRDGNYALVRYLRVIVPDAAEDVAAETWIQVIRGLPGFRGDELAWRAWLFTTARRRAIDEGRRRARRPTVPLEDLPAGTGPRSADAADVALDNLSTEAAIALVAELPPLQAEVVLLRVVAGLDVQTVGRMVGRSPGAVRVIAHRALRRLAATLGQMGVTL